MVGKWLRRGAAWLALLLLSSLLCTAPALAQTASDPHADPLIAAATAAEARGDWDASQLAWQAVLARETAADRATQFDSIRAVSGIADSLSVRGRHADALPWAERAYDLSRSSFGDTADWTMGRMFSVATVRSALGDYPAAIDGASRYIAYKRARDQNVPMNRHNLAMALLGTADIYRRAARWDEAIATMQEGISIERTGYGTEQTAAYRSIQLVGLLSGAGRWDAVRQVLRDSIGALRIHYGPTNPITLEQIETLGSQLVYQTDDIAGGVVYLTEACAGWRSLGAARIGELRRCLAYLADGYDYQDREVEELPARRELLALARSIDGPASPAAMAAAEKLVEALSQAGEIDLAFRIGDETLAMSAVIALPATDKATLQARTAEVALLSANLDRAEALFRQVVDGLQPLADRASERTRAEAQLAHLAFMRGNYVEADVGFRRVLPLLRSDAGEGANLAAIVEPIAAIAALRAGHVPASALSGPGIAEAQNTDEFSRAFTALASGDYAAAAAGFAEVSADLNRRYPIGSRPEIITMLAAYVNILRAASLFERDDLAQAEMLFRNSLAQLNPIDGALATLYKVTGYYGLGRLLRDRRDNAAAIAALQTALRLARTSNAIDDVLIVELNETLASALRNADMSSRAPLPLLLDNVRIARRSRDRAALGSDAGAGAADQALARATAAQRSQIDPLRITYASYLDEASRSPYHQQASEFAQQDAIFAAAQDLAVSNAGSAMRATAARLSLGTGRVADLGRQQASLAEQARGIETSLAELRNGSNEAALSAATAERTAIAERLAAIDAAIDAEAPDYRLLLRPRAIGLEQFRDRLQSGEALLLIAGGGDFSTFVIAVSRNRFAWHRIPDDVEVGALGGQVRCSLDPTTCASSDDDLGGLPPFAADAAHQLYQQMIAPVADALGEADRIFVTATGRLGELPLAVLVTEAPVPGVATRWFGDDKSFILLPSVAALRAVPNRRGAAADRPPYIAYGAPDLAPRPNVPWTAPPIGLADPAMLRASFGPLATARREMTEVASALGAPETMVFSAAAATETAVRHDVMLPRARVVHFATHGLLPDPRSPAILDEPGLIFTPPDRASAADDGVLSASEAAAMHFSADWLILSACTTATAGGGQNPAIGDADSLGLLARAFLYAGTRRLVASHWNLSDATGRILVTGMLRSVADDPALRPSQALAQAQATIRTGRRSDASPVFGWDESWQHPFFWASLSMIAYDDDR